HRGSYALRALRRVSPTAIAATGFGTCRARVLLAACRRPLPHCSRRCARLVPVARRRSRGRRRSLARMVHCVLLGEEAYGLDRPPYPGPLGQRIFENVSKLAWQRWLKHQTMLINEYRLTPIEPKARKFLEIGRASCREGVELTAVAGEV